MLVLEVCWLAIISEISSSKTLFFVAFSVYADGSICLDILQNQWSPIYDVAAILTSIQVNVLHLIFVSCFKTINVKNDLIVPNYKFVFLILWLCVEYKC